MSEEAESWHLSKSVPITFILAVLIQTLSLVAYVSNMSASLDINTRDIARHEIRIASMEKTTQELRVLNARIDENIKAIREMMETSRKDSGR